MTDCSNIDIRELLPELLHDSLAPDVRARVLAHLATCDTCAAEFGVLQAARRAMASVRVPMIDTSSIVASLPRPVTVQLAHPARRRMSTLYRLAAAISFISLGGISVAVARSYLGDVAPYSVDSAGSGESAGSVPPLALGIDSRRAAQGGGSMSVHPAVGALDDADLESLLDELELLEAAPLAEPETTPGGRAIAGAIIGS